MELNFLAFVWNGIGVLLVSSKRDEITVVIVTPEKGGKVRENLIGQRFIVAVFADFLPEALNFGSIIRVHSAVADCFFKLRKFFFLIFYLSSTVLREFLLYLRQELFVKELFYLRPLGVHDAVYAEIKVGLIHLEHFPEDVFQFIVLVQHGDALLKALFYLPFYGKQMFAFGFLCEPFPELVD